MPQHVSFKPKLNDDTTAQEMLARLDQLERENAALKLKLSHHSDEADCNFFKKLFLYAQTPCMVIDTDGSIVFANQAAACLLVTTPEFLMEQSLQKFIFKDQVVFEEQLTTLIASAEPSSFELKMFRCDKELLLLCLNMMVLKFDELRTYVYIQFKDITREQGKFVLQPEQESFASVVVENVPGLVAYWTNELRCTYANHHYLSWFGRTNEQMRGIHMKELLGDELFLKNIAYIQAALSGNNQEFERSLVKANGEIGYTLAKYIAHKVDGIVKGFFVLVTDVSLLKRARDALASTEAKQRALVSAIPDMVLTIHRDGSCIDVHAPDPSMLLLSRRQLLHSKISEVLPPNIVELYEFAMEKSLNHGTLQEFKYQMFVSGKGELHFEVRIAPCDHDTVIAVVRDITLAERERRENELQLTDRLSIREKDLHALQLSLTMASHITNIGTWVRNIKTGELLTSKEWRRLFGFNEDETITVEMVLLRINPADRHTIENMNRNFVSAPQQRFQAEFRVMLPNDTERWLAAVWQVERDEQEQASLTRGVVVDISVRKVAELELVEKRMEVMHLARVATMGELSGALAHELNQPLTAILSNAQAAQRFLVSPKVDILEIDAILQDIVDEDKRAGEIIQRLRRLFDKRCNKQQIVDINWLVLEVQRILRNDMINHGITLLSELQEDLPAVSADVVQLQQVLINLIMNASDVVAEVDVSQRKIEINTRLTQENNVEVSVNDCGVGVPESLQSIIFEAFYTTKATGMGLGLSISKNIIESYGGRLWCENRENSANTGASFRFQLPAILDQQL